MGRQIARSAARPPSDIAVFCLTFAQLHSIGDERNVSKRGGHRDMTSRLLLPCLLNPEPHLQI